MIDHHTPPDPDVRRLIEQSLAQLDAFAGTVRSASDAQARLTQAVHVPNDPPPHHAELRETIDQLFGQGHWAQALPLATRLLMAAPSDPSASYRLGTCLQRMHRPAEALAAFAHCLASQGDQPSPGPLLRLAECLAAIGHRDDAVQCLHTCVELARTDPDHRELQALALQLTDDLRR